MASVDDLSGSIGRAKDAIVQAAATVTASIDEADHLAEGFKMIGVDGKVDEVNAIKVNLEALHSGLAAAAELVENIQAQAEALRGSGNAPNVAATSSALTDQVPKAGDRQRSAPVGRQYRSSGDPMRALGAGRQTHPAEWQAHLDDAESYGVEIRHRPGAIFYTPGLRRGQPGQLVIDDDASISAMRHEMSHVQDDKNAGWRGFEGAYDKDFLWASEERAYKLEIGYAHQVGRADLAAELTQLMAERKTEIYGTEGLPCSNRTTSSRPRPPGTCVTSPSTRTPRSSTVAARSSNSDAAQPKNLS
ncbi:hypothetical protein L0U85_03440 [Glycomyces sp. L485]|uniref:hypothetical protein n=1 Tax=Glycomyces sp. L485 TaxID=2909235 RepID=UPI001F4BA4D6|nr:hypothetical protein [Glycomyces sp. L485]MCH7229916.1 hypothetical protein [Glycomyces sp. L485]